MNLSLEKYLSGAGLLDRVVYPGRGRRVVVLDNAKGLRSAVRRLLRDGLSAREIARKLDRPEAVIAGIAEKLETIQL